MRESDVLETYRDSKTQPTCRLQDGRVKSSIELKMDHYTNLVAVKELIDKMSLPLGCLNPSGGSDIPTEIKSLIFERFKDLSLESVGLTRQKQVSRTTFAKKRRANQFCCCFKCGRTNCDGVWRLLQGGKKPCDNGSGILSGNRALRLEVIRYGRVGKPRDS
uniref:HP n=1 Tax=Melampyrum betaflexivirus 1 TaxID=2794405 RepID=A0A8B0CSC7_9VIRU|nr:HP [Melampyrum betaflexivirus 1]